jgi:glucuronate isomerase
LKTANCKELNLNQQYEAVLDEDFLLSSKTAQRLYHEFAKPMPVIDYHNHLPPDQIANNINFENLAQAWL